MFEFFLITLISFSIVIWVFQSVNYLDIIIEDGRDYWIYLQYSLLNLPKIVSRIIPFAIFVGFFYTLVKYETNNELIIFWNFGVNKIRVINYLFIFSFALILIQLILTNFVVPKSQDLARKLIKNSDANNLSNIIKPKKFNDTIKGLTIYSDSRTKEGELLNIYLKKETNNEDFQITYAKRGMIQKAYSGQILRLFDGETINFVKNKITRFKFSRSDFNMTELETNFISHSKTQEINTFDLIKCFFYIDKKNITSKIINCSLQNFINVTRELYKRIFIPIYISVLILITLLILVYSKEEVDYFKFKILIFFLGILTIIFSEISVRFIHNDLKKNIMILLTPILSVILFYLFINLKFRIKKFKK